MDIIVNDVLILILNYIPKITDKRTFSRTCKTIHNAIRKHIKIAILHFNEQYGYIYENCPERFIIEQYYDGYIKIDENVYRELMTVKSIRMQGEKLSLYVKMIIASNNIELFQLALKNGYRIGFDPTIIDFAIIVGQLDILKYLENIRKCFVNTNSISIAATAGHLDVIKWLVNNKRLNITPSNYCEAAKNGHLNIVKFFVEKITYMNAISSSDILKFCNEAAKYGHLDILIWQKNGLKYSFNMDTCKNAVEGGHLNILIWLIDNGYECNDYIFECAAENGHLNILKWGFQKGYKLPDNISEIAATYGKLYIIIWLHENNFKFDQNVHVCAAESGNLELIKRLASYDNYYVNGVKAVFYKKKQSRITKMISGNEF